ncbi:MAG TPA: CotH kinase family protein, partial [Polyangiaceae bacterium]
MLPRLLALISITPWLGFACGSEPSTSPKMNAPQAGASSTSGGGGAAGGVVAPSAGTSVAGNAGLAGAAPASGGGVPGGGTSTEGGASAEAGAANGGASAGAGAPTVAPDASAEIYDPERVPRFDIELPPDSVAALTEDPDTYVRATFRYENETIADIGVRIKGEASLRPLTAKAALKLKFDEFVDDQSFKGLRRLTLNNMVEDPSFLAERLAYHLFRAANLPAPRCNSALVYVNGQAYGLYANVEAEDKTFLRRWFESDEGNLYEEGQVDFVTGAEQRFNLETNQTANDRSDLASLIELVESATDAN